MKSATARYASTERSSQAESDHAREEAPFPSEQEK